MKGNKFCPECGSQMTHPTPTAPFCSDECREAVKWQPADSAEAAYRALERPVGHVTDLIRGLTRWRQNRAVKGLDNGALKMAVDYLEEYRVLLRLIEADETLAHLLSSGVRGKEAKGEDNVQARPGKAAKGPGRGAKARRL
jgi:hypothetical protein